jgi:hypothetical protein
LPRQVSSKGRNPNAMEARIHEDGDTAVAAFKTPGQGVGRGAADRVRFIRSGAGSA